MTKIQMLIKAVEDGADNLEDLIQESGLSKRDISWRLTRYKDDIITAGGANLFSSSVTVNNINIPEAKPSPKDGLHFTASERYEFLDEMIGMVNENLVASLFVTGEGGTGKTYEVRKKLDDLGLVPINRTTGVGDYLFVKGFSTPKGLFNTLRAYSDKLIIFDDCDSVFNDKVGKNILKGATDSYDVRTVTWESDNNKTDDDGYFNFTGKIIFISNIPASKFDQALKSRSLLVDMTLTIEDKISRMEEILPNIEPGVDMELKQEALQFLREHAYLAEDFNYRTLVKTIKLFIQVTDPIKRERIAKYAI